MFDAVVSALRSKFGQEEETRLYEFLSVSYLENTLCLAPSSRDLGLRLISVLLEGEAADYFHLPLIHTDYHSSDLEGYEGRHLSWVQWLWDIVNPLNLKSLVPLAPQNFDIVAQASDCF